MSSQVLIGGGVAIDEDIMFEMAEAMVSGMTVRWREMDGKAKESYMLACVRALRPLLKHYELSPKPE